MHARLVNVWEAEEHRCEVVMASDVVRDGMAFELTYPDEARGPGPSARDLPADVDHTSTISALGAVDVAIKLRGWSSSTGLAGNHVVIALSPQGSLVSLAHLAPRTPRVSSATGADR